MEAAGELEHGLFRCKTFDALPGLAWRLLSGS